MSETVKPCWWPDCRAMPSVKVICADSTKSTFYTCRDHLPPLQRSLRKRVLTFKPIIHLQRSDPPLA